MSEVRLSIWDVDDQCESLVDIFSPAVPRYDEWVDLKAISGRVVRVVWEVSGEDRADGVPIALVYVRRGKIPKIVRENEEVARKARE